MSDASTRALKGPLRPIVPTRVDVRADGVKATVSNVVPPDVRGRSV